jgi:hypothetical protein
LDSTKTGPVGRGGTDVVGRQVNGFHETYVFLVGI